MAYDVSYDWGYARPKRWRRWIARLFAVLALGASGFGLWTIAREAADSGAPPPATLEPELLQLAGSTEALAVRLQALRPGASRAKAAAALREARADQQAAVAQLRRRRASGAVRADALLGNALEAHGEYLSTVGQILRNPRSRAVADLQPRARRARAAFAALPDPAAVPRAIRGWPRLVAYGRASRG